MRAIADFHFFTIDYIATDDSCAKELKRGRKTTIDCRVRVLRPLEAFDPLLPMASEPTAKRCEGCGCERVFSVLRNFLSSRVYVVHVVGHVVCGNGGDLVEE
jgi:hypothetical protein